MKKSETARVYLFNNSPSGHPPGHVDAVSIIGQDSSEFAITANGLGYSPMVNFDLKPGDSIWVDLLFNPDETKPYPARFADRHAQLIARGPGEKDKIINLYGIFAGESVVKNTSHQSFFSLYPNPASGNSVVLSFSGSSDAIYGVSTVEIDDMLGRVRFHKEMPGSIENMVVPIQNLENGVYTILLETAGGVFSEKLEIAK